MNKIFISQAKAFQDQTVKIEGWVTHKRSSGKIKFLNIRDGTGFIQAIFLEHISQEAFQTFDTLTQETSVCIVGKLRQEPRALGGFELTVESMLVYHIPLEPFPVAPKEHGIEFLMKNRHLWLRSTRPWMVLKVRDSIIEAIHTFFRAEGFIQFDAPILTPNSCEGTSTLFSTDYFDEKAYLTQSGQLYGEVGAMAFGKIYTFGPTFRAEKSKTRKHLTEFWMIEPEIAFIHLNELMELGQNLIHFIIKHVIQKRSDELTALGQDIKKLESFLKPFERIHYDQALEILKKYGFDLPWGEDFGAPHETALGQHFQAPVFIHHMPAQMKAFYFKHEGKTALACDLIAPDGYGELIGGGCREESYETLKQRIIEHQLDLQDYNWYLDLRKYGSVPHGGFGLGLERTIAWLTHADHVRETIPFPRLIQQLRP